MTTLYFVLVGIGLVSALIWAVYKLGQRGAKNKYENELLKIRAEKHKRDQDITAKPFVIDPLSRLRDLAKK